MINFSMVLLSYSSKFCDNFLNFSIVLLSHSSKFCDNFLKYSMTYFSHISYQFTFTFIEHFPSSR